MFDIFDFNHLKLRFYSFYSFSSTYSTVYSTKKEEGAKKFTYMVRIEIFEIFVFCDSQNNREILIANLKIEYH